MCSVNKQHKSIFIYFYVTAWKRTLVTASVRHCSSGQENTQTTDQNVDEDPGEEVKTHILHAALDFVPEYGWTRKSIIKGNFS